MKTDCGSDHVCCRENVLRREETMRLCKEIDGLRGQIGRLERERDQLRIDRDNAHRRLDELEAAAKENAL